MWVFTRCWWFYNRGHNWQLAPGLSGSFMWLTVLYYLMAFPNYNLDVVWQCSTRLSEGRGEKWWRRWGLISEGMQAEYWGKMRRGVCFTLLYCRHTASGPDTGQDSCMQSRTNPDPCQVKRQQADKYYSHMKTEWISRLNFFTRDYVLGPAGRHCSTPAELDTV